MKTFLLATNANYRHELGRHKSKAHLLQTCLQSYLLATDDPALGVNYSQGKSISFQKHPL